MVLEIYSPNVKISEKTLDLIKRKLLLLSRLKEKISRAEIFLQEESLLPKHNKVCKIRLEIFGNTLFVEKKSTSFQTAAISALKTLKRRLKEKSKLKDDTGDEVTSTVKV